MSGAEGFISHLIELRDRLLKAIVALLIVFFILFYWARDIYSLLAAPLIEALPEGSTMIAVDVAAPFFVPIKVTLFASFVVALPVVLYQVWAFIAPGLYTHEKRLVVPLIATSTILFLVGCLFAYLVVFPTVFHFVAAFTPEGVEMNTDIQKYFDFVLMLFLAFGLAFETPIVVIILARMGIVSIKKLKESRPYLIVGAFVVAAIFTPPDVISQLLLAFPIWILFEIGLFIAGILEKKADQRETLGED
ncbi:MAG: twin-arginine translocase subunit TatC [Proteobacteria bacterium]|nr:twin-arginine translocase subunit TatC [Pseudomonadota bacterium]MDA1332532.1 twin-arginine translocase subunit TatC [Pseudomonadota bacterium]